MSTPLVVAISSRALFDLDQAHSLYLEQGLDAYLRYQMTHEDAILGRGVAFPMVEKLLALNQLNSAVRVEVILLSRNSGNSGLRIFNSIEHYGLDICRAAFTNGAPPHGYIEAFGADLFLSAHPEDVKQALDAGFAAASIVPRPNKSSLTETSTPPRAMHSELRIAFDGDAVLFGDEAERVHREQGLERFHQSERELAQSPLSGGPFRKFLDALQRLQHAFPADASPIRTALVTARSAPAHKRVILTLRDWGVRLDEALFLGGRDKGAFLQAFGADIFFDDQAKNIESAVASDIASAHVPHGVANQ